MNESAKVIDRVPSDTGLREEAAHRLARSLSERFNAEDRRMLEEWLAADPAHEHAFEEARRSWQQFEALRDDPDIMALGEEEEEEARPRKRRSAVRPLALAASLAVVAIAAGVFWQARFGPEVLATQPWEQRSVTLADGSAALLGSDTRVAVRADELTRGATVRQGEAVFDVEHDPTRPFIVTAGDAEIVVTGTRFKVRHQDGRVTVTLLEGAIELQRDRFAYRQKLEPGQQAEFAENEPQTAVHPVDVAEVTDWTKESLVFRDAPLSEALREANRHGDLKLTLRDRGLGDIPVNGHFRRGDTESLLAALERSLPIQAHRLDNNEVLLTRHPDAPKPTPWQQIADTVGL